MASISTDRNTGRRRILFKAPDGSRKAIHLGKTPLRTIQAIRLKVEHLVSAAMGGPLDDETSRWLANLDETLNCKLARVGLTVPREKGTLKKFLDTYIANRTDIKPSTQRHLRQAANNLVTYFGPGKSLRDITPGDADEFRLNLLQRLGDNTTRRMCGRAKQFFRHARRKKLVAENPFGEMKGCGVRPNKSRDYFVTREEADSVLEACPNAQWRLLFVLSRYGGLRCPSEHLSLRWGDVDWERGRIRVPSPKTAYQGKDERLIPLFPELRAHLEAVWDEAPAGTEFVITRYREKNANLRTQFLRIIKRAGLTPWPKLFQNLRSTRETELIEEFPLQTVTAWLGNTPTVALKHYLQVRESDFERATSDAKSASNSKSARQTAQSAHGTDGMAPQSDSDAHEKTPVLQGCGTSNDALPNEKMPPQGLEP